MSEMVERVAAAMRAVAEYEDANWGEPARNIENWPEIARAAIEALKVPTDAMIEAGDNATTLDSLPDVFLAQWQAALDAALRDA